VNTGDTNGNAVERFSLRTDGISTLSGSLNITGSLNVSGNITGSLLGTASFASQAITSSITTNVEVNDVPSNNAINYLGFYLSNTGYRPTRVASTKFVINPATGSMGINKSTITNGYNLDISGSALITGSITASLGFFGTASYALTASYVLNAISSSFASTASFAPNYVLNSATSSFITNTQTGSFATTGSNQFNGNQTITGSLIQGLGNAAGENSHAEGDSTQAIGLFSHAEGLGTIAYGGRSHAEGQDTIASGSYSHTEGYQTIALADHQHVQGQWNATSSVPAAFIVGNGTDDSNRSNLIHAAGNEFQITGSFLVSGSSRFTGTQIITGSTQGNVTALSISSNTASMDLSVGNFFTLQLVSGSNTYINPSNILPGQTSILTVSTTGSATVSFPSLVKQPSGSVYIPTTTTGVDIITLASVDASTLYVVNIKNMI
jgi:hypothetical protein